jgi:flavorubredoxin
MMKTVVVYESMFGNTKAVAEAIAEGLGHAGEVTFGTVDDVSPDEARGATLIVVGGPTHARGLAKSNAHLSLAGDDSFQQYGPVLPGEESLRGWLERLPTGDGNAVAFDTRYERPMVITGSAAKKISSRLKSKGYSVTETQSFFVESVGGPLADGERERAVEWGRELAAGARTTVTA